MRSKRSLISVQLLCFAIPLFTAGGAKAEDAVVPYEWEQGNSVAVCDVFGPGYTQVPGTGTCVKVSGEVRYERSISKSSQSGARSETHGRYTLDFETRGL